MSYNPAIPDDFPPPNVAVDSIRTNFSQYSTIFDNNHSPLNASTQGKHTNVILQQQGSDPEIEGDYDSLYGKSVITTSSTSDEVFVKIPQFLPNDTPNDPVQLTFNSVNTTGIPVYQSFLPGGYIIYFGSIPSGPLNTPVTAQITLSPIPSKILCVIPNPTTSTLSGFSTSAPQKMSVTIDNNFQFTVFANAPGVGFFTGIINWLAIAKQ